MSWHDIQFLGTCQLQSGKKTKQNKINFAIQKNSVICHLHAMPYAFCLFCQASFQMDEFPGLDPCMVALRRACTEVVGTVGDSTLQEQVVWGLHKAEDLR